MEYRCPLKQLKKFLRGDFSGENIIETMMDLMLKLNIAKIAERYEGEDSLSWRLLLIHVMGEPDLLHYEEIPLDFDNIRHIAKMNKHGKHFDETAVLILDDIQEQLEKMDLDKEKYYVKFFYEGEYVDLPSPINLIDLLTNMVIVNKIK